jgi:hypothetical protein
MNNIVKIEGEHQGLSSRQEEAPLRAWATMEPRCLGRGDISTVAKAIDNVWDSELLTTRLNTAHVAKFP